MPHGVHAIVPLSGRLHSWLSLLMAAAEPRSRGPGPSLGGGWATGMGRGEWTSWEFGAQGEERVFPFFQLGFSK